MADISQYTLFGASLYTVSLLVAGIALFSLLSYRWALPKPIPGIPYNPAATKNLLGDVPEMMKNMQKTDQIFPWLAEQNVKLSSPIVQVWARPFAKPWVIIADFKESQDILMRRTKEFDRSAFFGDLFTGLIPDHHISKKSTDEKFKSNRFLMKDLMTPAFLHSIAAPQIYSAVTSLIELWTEKMAIAQGHPFSAFDDVYNAALDAIFAATFGLETNDSVIASQLDFIQSKSKTINVSADIDENVIFPKAPYPPAFEAVLTLTESLEPTIKSPVPTWHHWYLRQLPSMRKAKAIKEAMINGQIERGIKRIAEGDMVRRCALDDIMHREMTAAKKEDRAPVYTTRAISDELFGFLIAGHDTTSTTVTWALKQLADNPSVQQKLRTQLKAFFTAAAAEKRAPTVDEITKSHIPYLDASLEEITRIALTTQAVNRIALVDTTVMGHAIPKGTDVFLMGNGPDFFSKSFPVDDSLRSETSRSTKGRQVGSWDPSTMNSFMPERWLVRDEESGKEVFDSLSGPHLGFGLGPRGCYGKKLAYLELRIMIVMVIWNFELLGCPEGLSGYGAVDRLTRQPRQCFVRLAKAQY